MLYGCCNKHKLTIDGCSEGIDLNAIEGKLLDREDGKKLGRLLVCCDGNKLMEGLEDGL
jgi:hypothetical protein